MAFTNCGNCGGSFDLAIIRNKKSKFRFGGATQHQQKCPRCKVALATWIPEDEEDQAKLIDPNTLPEGVADIMVRENLCVKRGKAARARMVKEAAALDSVVRAETVKGRK